MWSMLSMFTIIEGDGKKYKAQNCEANHVRLNHDSLNYPKG